MDLAADESRYSKQLPTFALPDHSAGTHAYPRHEHRSTHITLLVRHVLACSIGSNKAAVFQSRSIIVAVPLRVKAVYLQRNQYAVLVRIGRLCHFRRA